MGEAVSVIVGTLLVVSVIIASEFASFNQGRQDYFDSRVEKLRLRQKRRLLQRKKS